jgi:heme A synthase
MLGSACGSFTQSILAAKLQEQVPDSVRGQASGVMYAAVAVQLALGIVVTTSVVSAWSTFAYSVLLACLLLFAVVFLQGFRQVK